MNPFFNLFIVLINILGTLKAPTSHEIDFKCSTEKSLKPDLIEFIDSAQKSLKIAIFTLNDPCIINAIIRAQERIFSNEQVNSVHLVIDGKRDANKVLKYLAADGSNINISDYLKQRQIIVNDNPYGNGHMHSKYVIVDEKKLLMGSLNFTENAIVNCKDSIIITNDPEAVADTLKNFETLQIKTDSESQRGDQTTKRTLIKPEKRSTETVFSEIDFQDFLEGKKGPIKTLFSMPTEVRPIHKTQDGKTPKSLQRGSQIEEKIITLIKSAKKSLHIAINCITSNNISEAIKEKIADPDIKIYVIGDIGCVNIKEIANQQGQSQKGGQLSALADMRKIRIFQDISSSTIMHNKYIIVDKEKVAIGSFNFTGQANTKNHECVAFVNNSNFAQKVVNSYKNLYVQCKLKIEKKHDEIVLKEAEDSAANSIASSIAPSTANSTANTPHRTKNTLSAPNSGSTNPDGRPCQRRPVFTQGKACRSLRYTEPENILSQAANRLQQIAV